MIATPTYGLISTEDSFSLHLFVLTGKLMKSPPLGILDHPGGYMGHREALGRYLGDTLQNSRYGKQIVSQLDQRLFPGLNTHPRVIMIIHRMVSIVPIPVKAGYK